MQASSVHIGRLSGLATILSGPLWAVGGIAALNADALGIRMTGPHLVLTLAGLLSLLGLARLFRHQSGHFSRAGLAGVLLASAGVILIILSKNLPVSDQAGWGLFYLGVLVLVGGSLLSGVAFLIHEAWFFGGPLVTIGVLFILEF